MGNDKIIYPNSINTLERDVKHQRKNRDFTQEKVSIPLKNFLKHQPYPTS